MAEPAGRGRWRLRNTPRARSLAEYVLAGAPASLYKYWPRSVPEVYYYVAEPPA